MIPNCIDVSTWQRNIDWNRVKAAGIQAVIIRAGFGQTKDKLFESHYAGARAAGLYIGAYWYSYAYSVDQAEQEALACIDILRGKTFDLPVYYDMEEDDQMALGKSVMTDMACRFIDTMQAAGYRGGMYSSPSWFSDFIDYDLMRSRDYSIWLAHWASQPARVCDIWQYGENGSIDGIDGDVDVDIIKNRDILDDDISTPTPEPAADGVTAKEAMDAACSLIGKDEKPNECDIMAWYGGFDTDIYSVACCCAGMMYLFFNVLNAGYLIPGGKCADCGTLALNFYNAGQLHQPADVRPGDLVIFSWSHEKTSVSPLDSLGFMCFEHVELCLEVRDDTILSIGANNGGTECDDFQIKTRSRADISACCRPKYADGESEPDVSETVAVGNEAVREVQQWLNSRYHVNIDTDGIYGAQTRKALTKALQAELNEQFGAWLAVDGIYGPQTKAVVRNISGGVFSNYIKVLQGFLICNGYDTGGLDGVFGNATDRAVRQYQRDNSLTVDGIAGRETFGALCG